MKKLFTATLFAASSIALALVATPASAQAVEDTTLFVQRADLDLSTAAGRKAYELRVTHAIAEMCPADALTRTQKQCELSARAAIKAQESATGIK